MQPLASFVGSGDCGSCAGTYEGGGGGDRWDPRNWDKNTWIAIVISIIVVCIVVWLAYTYWSSDGFKHNKIADETAAQLSHFHFDVSGPSRPAPAPYNHHLHEVAQGDFQKIVHGVSQIGVGGPFHHQTWVPGPSKESFGINLGSDVSSDTHKAGDTIASAFEHLGTPVGENSPFDNVNDKAVHRQAPQPQPHFSFFGL